MAEKRQAALEFSLQQQAYGQNTRATTRQRTLLFKVLFLMRPSVQPVHLYLRSGLPAFLWACCKKMSLCWVLGASADSGKCDE